MRVEFVHMRLHDLQAEVDLGQVATILGRTARDAPLIANSPVPATASMRPPKEVKFVWRPEEAAMASQSAPGDVQVEVRLHAVGVAAVRVRWFAELDAVEAIGAAGRAFLGGDAGVDAQAERLVRQVRHDLAPMLGKPYPTRVEPERYLVYCLCVDPKEGQRILAKERDWLAALVSDEPEPPRVPARLEAALKHIMQYNPGDAVLPGWDHAVVLGTAQGYEDVLDVVELANLELLEFRTYDSYLDDRLEAATRAVDRLWGRGGLLRSARAALQDISQVRADVTRLTDNVHDTGKLFGDWYTAQLHQRLQARFHLASWERAIANKMDALEDMFHLAQEEANHRRSLVLEGMIVLLFILDLAILLRQGH